MVMERTAKDLEVIIVHYPQIDERIARALINLVDAQRFRISAMDDARARPTEDALAS